MGLEAVPFLANIVLVAPRETGASARSVSEHPCSRPSRTRNRRSTRFGGTTMRTILTGLSRGYALGNMVSERW
jgi:hypothetical protein